MTDIADNGAIKIEKTVNQREWIRERERVALRGLFIIAKATEDQRSPLCQLKQMQIIQLVKVAGAASVIAFNRRNQSSQEACNQVKRQWSKEGIKMSRVLWSHAFILGEELWEFEQGKDAHKVQ